MANPSPLSESLPEAADDYDPALAAALREGIADADAGRTMPYEEVRRWLLSWGTPDELPPPERIPSPL